MPCGICRSTDIITDHTDISVLLCQQIDQLKLYKVRVLVLVHHDIPEFILIIFQHIRVCLEKFYRFHQQIVEIQGIILLEFFLVFPVNLSNLFLPEVRSRLLLKLIRRDPVIFAAEIRDSTARSLNCFGSACIFLSTCFISVF